MIKVFYNTNDVVDFEIEQKALGQHISVESDTNFDIESFPCYIDTRLGVKTPIGHTIFCKAVPISQLVTPEFVDAFNKCVEKINKE